MKIGIDISQIVYGTGVSIYTRELVRNLLKLNLTNEYVLYGGSLRQKKFLTRYCASLSGRFTAKIYPIPPTIANLIWNRLHILPIEKLIGKVDVFHFSDWTQPPTTAFSVTTVHDLAPLRFPKLVHPKVYYAHKNRLNHVKREADRIIVPSEATKKELLEFGVSAEKIRVIYEAPEDIYYKRSEEEVQKVMAKYKIRGSYLLAVGVGQRKNTERLIKAYELATAGSSLKLVIVGKPLNKIPEGRGINFLGFIPTQDLPALYSGAEALLYPSLYEGFGLPILEAFAVGCPVVTSNLSSMTEIAGDAAVLVDPYEIESISEGIKKVLKGKIGFSKKGLTIANKYSWQKTALETLKVYQEAKKIKII